MSRVLAAIDLSEGSTEALRQANAYAVRTKGTLAVIHVVPDLVGTHTLFPQETAPATFDAIELKRKVGELLAQRVVDVTSRKPDEVEVFVDEGVDYAQIAKRAEDWKADVVVIGTHGHGGLERVFGNVADKVVRYAHAKVLVARASKNAGPIVAATDLSDPSLPAIAAAAEEARRAGAPLHVVHAIDAVGGTYFSALAAAFGAPPVLPSAEVQEQARKALVTTLEKALERTGAKGEAVILEGSPTTEVVRYAEKVSARLLVLATHGRTGLRRVALGSVAEKVIRSAHCPVLVVRFAH